MIGKQVEVGKEEEDIVAFCRRVQPRLVSTLALHCGRLDVAEEVAQEALARAWERWATVSTVDSPERWVYRVGLNLSTSVLRRRMLERRPHPDRGRSRTTDADSDARIVVRQALAGLPVRQRSALLLRYFADFSVDDTAAVMGCAPGTVKALTSQGLQRVRQHPVLAGELSGTADR